MGINTTLTATVVGGVWSSSNSSVASVDANGNLSPVSVGNASITYTVTNAAGCNSFVTKSIIVNALPVLAAITGSNTVCMGSSITLANDSIGGMWNSGNFSVATIDNAGVVTPVGAGSTTIDYMITNATRRFM